MTDELKMLPMLQQNKTFTTEFRGVRYEYYLTGVIGDPEEYLDLCNILRSASSQDEVIIRFNTPGGQVRTGNMIINAINESEATVVGFIESDCGSMGTYIFLACHTWGVSEAAEFFCHTCSSGSFGKEHETYEQAVFLRKQQHKLMRKRYANFLTEEEIDKVIAGSDVYLDADEIMERLEVYAEAREMRGCGNPECQECGVDNDPEDESTEGGFDLKDLIKQAVNEALAEREAVKATDKPIVAPTLLERLVDNYPAYEAGKIYRVLESEVQGDGGYLLTIENDLKSKSTITTDDPSFEVKWKIFK